MTFESFASGQSFFLWSSFVIALIMGMGATKTNFCTRGAVLDWVNKGDTGRLHSYLFAIAIAVLGIMGLEAAGMVDVTNSAPPYRQNQFVWAENLLGGLMFGIGMVLATGCPTKTLQRLAGGNIKSLMVILIIAPIAYFMLNPFPGTDQTLYSVLFHGWIRPLATTLSTKQDLGAMLFSPDKVALGRMIMGGIIGVLLLIFIFKSRDFRSNFNNILGGLVVGLAVLSAWYVTSNVVIHADTETMKIQKFAQDWDMFAKPGDVKPAQTGPLAPQSIAFINPMGQTVGYVSQGFNKTMLTFGMMAAAGFILGAFLWLLISRQLRIEWFSSFSDFKNHFIGAILMGFGGVLGLGCTISQGIVGFSTLALGSILTTMAIVFGSVLTMKIQYYKRMYETDATFFKAFVSALVDIKLLPPGMRKLKMV